MPVVNHLSVIYGELYHIWNDATKTNVAYLSDTINAYPINEVTTWHHYSWHYSDYFYLGLSISKIMLGSQQHM